MISLTLQRMSEEERESVRAALRKYDEDYKSEPKSRRKTKERYRVRRSATRDVEVEREIQSEKDFKRLHIPEEWAESVFEPYLFLRSVRFLLKKSADSLVLRMLEQIKQADAKAFPSKK